MNWIQIFDVGYLVLLLALLVAVTINSFRRGRRDEKILTILVSVSAKNAESAEQAVKNAQVAIDLLKEARHGDGPGNIH